jgi:hypothetical protein
MPEITENDLMKAILEDYRLQHKQPGDIGIKDILAAFQVDWPEFTDERARYIFDQWASRPDIDLVKVIDFETGKSVRVLRRKV